MNLRKIETGLAYFTLGALVIYFPVETWASLPEGLWNPFYIVDLIAMILMFWGAMRSLRARPASSPAVLCAAYAWAGANGWRATFDRLFEMLNGGTLAHGKVELWAVGIATAVGLVCFVLSLYLVVRSTETRA
jgi:hypothetical protein